MSGSKPSNSRMPCVVSGGLSRMLLSAASSLASPLPKRLVAGLCLAASSLFSAHALASQDPVVFVLNSLDASVSIVDAGSWKEVSRVPVGKEPHHIYLTPDGKSVLVANAASNSISVLDPITGKLERTITQIVDPYHLRFSPDMKWFVTAANRLNHIDIYRWNGLDAKEPFELIKRIPAAKTPSHIVIDSKSQVAYVTLQDSNELIAIDLPSQTALWTVPTGKMPADLHLSSDDKTLLVGLTGQDSVQVFSLGDGPAKPVSHIKTGQGAHAFRSAGDGKSVFVSNRTANTISRIDIGKLEVVAQYEAPGGPDCMELLDDGKTLMVTSRWLGRLTVIDLETGKRQQVRVGKSPHGVWTYRNAPRQ